MLEFYCIYTDQKHNKLCTRTINSHGFWKPLCFWCRLREAWKNRPSKQAERQWACTADFRVLGAVFSSGLGMVIKYMHSESVCIVWSPSDLGSAGRRLLLTNKQIQEDKFCLQNTAMLLLWNFNCCSPFSVCLYLLLFKIFLKLLFTFKKYY
jgi:hypothetical protein